MKSCVEPSNRKGLFRPDVRTGGRDPQGHLYCKYGSLENELPLVYPIYKGAVIDAFDHPNQIIITLTQVVFVSMILAEYYDKLCVYVARNKHWSIF